MRSLAIYLGSAFIILEASAIIFPRWDFTDRTIDLALWILVVGAVVNRVIIALVLFNVFNPVNSMK